MSDNPRAGLKIGLLVLICFGPLALAMVWYYAFPEMAPGAETNRGRLLQPAQPLPELTLKTPAGQEIGLELFRGQWTLLTLAPRGCGERCRARLENTRKVRALMGRRAPRVQRVLISGDATDAGLIRAGHPDLKLALGGKRLLDQFRKAGPQAVGPGVVYLIDPHGNWVLYYPAGQPADAMFEDVKHLLKLSHIG